MYCGKCLGKNILNLLFCSSFVPLLSLCPLIESLLPLPCMHQPLAPLSLASVVGIDIHALCPVLGFLHLSSLFGFWLRSLSILFLIGVTAVTILMFSSVLCVFVTDLCVVYGLMSFLPSF